MLIVMRSDATASDIERVLDVIETLGFRGHALPGENRTAIGITGNAQAIDPAHFENLPGVADAIRVTKPYKLISRDLKPERSITKVGNATIGGPELAMIAGPCALEDREQVFSTAQVVQDVAVYISGLGRRGAKDARGGPRRIWAQYCDRGDG
jgi:3-deoxy-7-phosphoheptulonate synthase